MQAPENPGSMGDGQGLAQMRAKRDRLDAQIKAAEKQRSLTWNTRLDDCAEVLGAWCLKAGVETETRSRKNEQIWDAGHGALTVHFGYSGSNYEGGLRLVSGRTLTLEWREVPEPDRFMQIVKALLGATDPPGTQEETRS
jgi:hypothetical protein